jgi:hypothetical protein
VRVSYDPARVRSHLIGDKTVAGCDVLPPVNGSAKDLLKFHTYPGKKGRVRVLEA